MKPVFANLNLKKSASVLAAAALFPLVLQSCRQLRLLKKLSARLKKT